MQTVRFSIIIPALNEEKLIENVLEQFSSEIKERYSIEVIVSDGGSSDNTVEKASKYADITIKDTGNKRQNISCGRNQGVQKSQGDVLVFLNADTIISDVNLFFREINAIFKNSKISAIAAAVRVFPAEEKLADRLFHCFYNNYVRVLNKFFMGMGRGECHIIKREFFLEAGGYDEKIFAGEDFDLYRRLRKSGKIEFLKNTVIYESPRRYRKYGYFKVFRDWLTNAVWISLFRKSLSKEWEQVR